MEAAGYGVDREIRTGVARCDLATTTYQAGRRAHENPKHVVRSTDHLPHRVATVARARTKLTICMTSNTRSDRAEGGGSSNSAGASPRSTGSGTQHDQQPDDNVVSPNGMVRSVQPPGQRPRRQEVAEMTRLPAWPRSLPELRAQQGKPASPALTPHHREPIVAITTATWSWPGQPVRQYILR